ncbi:MAG: hypothetical protein M3295_01510 [Chloroflexota bacterium]|nr:hypothetical protein [Chloroflexota bacterium]
MYIEVGRDRKRTFAGAVDWPGWCRSGRDADAAVTALFEYGPRYAAALSGSVKFDPPSDRDDLDVVEEVTGTATTDFGAPDASPRVDAEPLSGADLARQRKILRACWGTFDEVMKRTASVELRKGPRGGGRDHAKIAEHVLGAEESYTVRLGMRRPPTDDRARDPMQRMPALREAILASLGSGPDPDAANRKLWTPRFFVRRAAWHVLDHAWEVEDRATAER